MSDISQAQTEDDMELQAFADDLWASSDYQEWRAQVQRGVADGTIRREATLNAG